MRYPPKEGFAKVVAFASALPAIILPVYNPDLFWHLSAGRWMAENKAFPRADFLSSSLHGTPWIDFEWLSQLIFYAAFAVGSYWGIWFLKASLVVAVLLSFTALLRALQVGGLLLTTAIAVLSVGLLSHADLRPDLFTLVLLAALLRFLELKKLEPVWTLAVFALWSSLHGGFALGLIALAIYTAVAWFSEDVPLAKKRAQCLLAGAIGACLNPYGIGSYAVVLKHWSEQAMLARTIKEWGPLGFSNKLYWPHWGLLAALPVAAVWRYRRGEKEVPWALLAFAAYLGVAAVQHQRAALFFELAGVAALVTLLPEHWTPIGLLLAGQLAFLSWLVPRANIFGSFNPKFIPAGAARFIEKERAAIEPLKVYNQWEWGGYLGFKLWPWYKVSSDGRYLFHSQHDEEQQAGETSAKWQAHMAEKGYTAALVRNLETRFPTARKYPDGKIKEIPRPWYMFYFPGERWALTYWDAQSLLFVARDSADPEWVEAREYRWIRPRDEAALQDAIQRNEVDLEEAAAEEKRQLAEAGR